MIGGWLRTTNSRNTPLLAELVHRIQPGLGLLALVLAFLCLRHMRESGERGMGWLALSIVAYLINHVLTGAIDVSSSGMLPYLVMVVSASVALAAFLVAIRLYADAVASRWPGTPQTLFVMACCVFGLLIMLTLRWAPPLLHAVPALMLGYGGAVQLRMARQNPGLDHGVAGIMLFSHPAGWLLLNLLDTPPTLLRDILSIPYVAAGYALLSVTLSRSRREVARATQELRDAEARWSFALEGSAQGVWDWDIPSGMAYYSPRLAQMLGDASPGSSRSPARWFEPMHPDDVPPTRAALDRHLSGEATSFDVEYRIRQRDGGEKWFETRGKVVSRSATGEATRMIGVVADVSVRKFAELALADSLHQLGERKREVEQLNLRLAQRAIDAETAVRARDAFLRNVTHEFRTPMNHIMGAANLMAGSQLDEKQLKWLTMILDGARNLLKRIDATLDIARIESGGMLLESVDFGPAAVLEQACGMLSHRARDKGLAYQLDIAPGMPAVLRGDPTRLAQMVLNLLDNAITYTERGFVRVTAACAAPDASGVVLRVEVSDSGPGIAPELLATLFTPFTPGDSSPVRRYGGLGAGLSTTREIARLMGGDAGVSSEPGKGSAFWFSARLLGAKPL